MMNKAVVDLLRCPISGQPLTFHSGDTPHLATRDGHYRYPVEGGIAMLLVENAREQDGSSETSAP